MSWSVKATGGYGYGTAEARGNAEQIFFILTGRGWGLGAIAGVLGNLQFESEMNPWRWESDIILNSWDPAIDYSTTNGYGLFQFTPPGKYQHSSYARAYPGFRPNYQNSAGGQYDGYAQVLYVDEHADYIATPQYNIPYASFKQFTLNPRYCADVWLANYERGTANPLREDYADYWYNYLQNVTPIAPDYPPGYIGTVPVGAVVSAQRKGGFCANLLTRRLAGYPKTRSRWKRQRH